MIPSATLGSNSKILTGTFAIGRAILRKMIFACIRLERGESPYETPVGKDGPILGAISKIVTWRNLRRRQELSNRRLEIGPGPKRIKGFETLSCMYWPHVDYVCDATHRLPFSDNTFSLLYASHVLEHVAWYQTVDVLREWVRVLRPGGSLEIWVPDGLKVCRAFVEAEEGGCDPFQNDPWTRFNEEREPCKWASGRIFTYGDGTGRTDDPNWHRALFSPRYLRKVMEQAGLVDVAEMDRTQVRGHDHGWLNLGMRGMKPQPV